MKGFHRLLFVSTLVVLTIAALAPANQLLNQRQRIATERDKIDALLTENARLEKRLDRLHDNDYLEKVAREQLGMVLPGEISYVVVPPSQAVGSPEEAPPPKPPWYKRVWGKITGLVD